MIAEVTAYLKRRTSIKKPFRRNGKDFSRRLATGGLGEEKPEEELMGEGY